MPRRGIETDVVCLPVINYYLNYHEAQTGSQNVFGVSFSQTRSLPNCLRKRTGREKRSQEMGAGKMCLSLVWL